MDIFLQTAKKNVSFQWLDFSERKTSFVLPALITQNANKKHSTQIICEKFSMDINWKEDLLLWLLFK